MLNVFRRPKLDVQFQPSRTVTDEFARRMDIVGTITMVNEGADAEIEQIEMMVIAGFRRIPLDVPEEWRRILLQRGERKEGEVCWSVTLDAPLRAELGELSISACDQRRKRWVWRLPFRFSRM